jgi:hypothetical protein
MHDHVCWSAGGKVIHQELELGHEGSEGRLSMISNLKIIASHTLEHH